MLLKGFLICNFADGRCSTANDDCKEAVDAIKTLSLEEVRVVESSSHSSSKAEKKSEAASKKHHGKRHRDHQHHQQKEIQKQYTNPSMARQARDATQGTSGNVMMPEGASSDIIRSGHIELDTIYASNDTQAGRQKIMVNVCNAPNNSTVQCGCENINCPFCNLMLSIERTDPSVLQ